MARPSATAALLLLVLSLLAVAHCRTVVVATDHGTEPESTAAVAVNDEKVASDEEALPLQAEQHHDFEFLRLPSHRIHHHHHRPCSLHRHLWWKSHHGVYRDAPRRFHERYSGHGERREAVSRLAMILPAEEEAREAEEVKTVAEPDPDRSLPDSDGEWELVASREEPSSFADADGHDGEHAAMVRAWKKEMLRRWFHFHFHHGLRRHRPHHVHHDDEEEVAAPEGTNMKRFHFHHHHDEEDEEKNMVRKQLRHAEHDHDEDSDDEDEDVEEMVRRFRKAIMKRKFGHGHGRRFFHHFHHDHSHHRHAEEAEKPQAAGGEEESGVMAWIKGLMNRF